MTATRNGALGRLVTAASGWNTVFTVTADDVVLLKWVGLSNITGLPIRVQLALVSADGLVAIYLVNDTIAATTTKEWSSWTALNGGDQLEVWGDAAGLRVWAAGAILPGPSPVLPRTNPPLAPAAGI